MGKRRPAFQKLSEKELVRQQSIHILKMNRLAKEKTELEKNKETINEDTI